MLFNELVVFGFVLVPLAFYLCGTVEEKFNSISSFTNYL